MGLSTANKLRWTGLSAKQLGRPEYLRRYRAKRRGHGLRIVQFNQHAWPACLMRGEVCLAWLWGPQAVEFARNSISGL